MTLDAEGGYRASRRLKNALVADLVMEDLNKSSDYLLTDSMRDESEWTENLGRQLGMRIYSSGGIHDTLMVLIELLDDLLRTWPPAHTSADCLPIAEAATKNLEPIEVYATLLAGPGRWRKKRVQDGITVEGLSSALKPILARELASELSRVLGRWVDWDIRQLRERRDEAIKAAQEAKAAQDAAERAARPARRRRTPDEMAAIRGDNPVGTYQPKGRT